MHQKHQHGRSRPKKEKKLSFFSCLITFFSISLIILFPIFFGVISILYVSFLTLSITPFSIDLTILFVVFLYTIKIIILPLFTSLIVFVFIILIVLLVPNTTTNLTNITKTKFTISPIKKLFCCWEFFFTFNTCLIIITHRN